MSYNLEDWYTKNINILSIRIESNHTLRFQTENSIAEGLDFQNQYKVLVYNYQVMKELDNILQKIKFEDEIATLMKIQERLNKLEILNEYLPLNTFAGFEQLLVPKITNMGSIVGLSDVKSLIQNNNLSYSDINKIFLKQNIMDETLDSHIVYLQQNEYDDKGRDYMLYTWKDTRGITHQISYREAYKYWDEKTNQFITNHEKPNDEGYDMYVTMTIPNGIIINEGNTDVLVTYKNFDSYYPEFKSQLNNFGVYSKNDLKEIAKFNATDEGAMQLAVMSLEAIRNDYPEYVKFTNEELIQEMLNDQEEDLNSKIREHYNMADYVDEIKYHAIGYNLDINDNSTEMADVSPYDPTWQTLLWEALW